MTQHPSDRRSDPVQQVVTQGPVSYSINLRAVGVVLIIACAYRLILGALITYLTLGAFVALFVAFPAIPELLARLATGRTGYNPIFRWANRYSRIGFRLGWALILRAEIPRRIAALRQLAGK